MPIPHSASANPALTPASGGPDPDDEDQLIQRFSQDHMFILAGHRSHSSHASHSSHRSGSSGTYRAPVYTPRAPATPRTTAPSTRNERSTPRSSILPSSPAITNAQPLYSSPSATSIKNVVRQVQLGLTSYGYYTGAIDGIVGPQMRSALTRFQTDFNLNVTGTITPEVLDAFKIRAQ
ncbi:His-Xaa-Ser repeat protein HxsA [Novosphingobium profundi]|uniref:His-Xaa-Ser repeat protein HxsA n=1 Tax=Novosphingobium profundi TaxID=1774954 RepID=UPI003CCE8653